MAEELFALRLKRERTRLIISEAELAERLGVEADKISAWELGYQIPDIDSRTLMHKLSLFLDMTVKALRALIIDGALRRPFTVKNMVEYLDIEAHYVQVASQSCPVNVWIITDLDLLIEEMLETHWETYLHRGATLHLIVFVDFSTSVSSDPERLKPPLTRLDEILTNGVHEGWIRVHIIPRWSGDIEITRAYIRIFEDFYFRFRRTEIDIVKKPGTINILSAHHYPHGRVILLRPDHRALPPLAAVQMCRQAVSQVGLPQDLIWFLEEAPTKSLALSLSLVFEFNPTER